MSGQGSQRVRKSSPCSSKQGPMRATLPMSSLLRQSSNLRKSKSNSPTLSPTSAWKTRFSPDASLSGQRSPGSVNYKGKSKTLNSRSGSSFGSSAIRRTASLDAIYLKGQWPRDSFYMYCGHLLVDKATQTEESADQRKSHRYSECASDDKLEKYYRHRIRSSKEMSGGRERVAGPSLPLTPSSSTSEHTSSAALSSTQTPPTPTGGVIGASKAVPVNIPVQPVVPRAPMRSSIEGLNQEIERLVLKATGPQDAEREEEKSYQATPEGHRAPLADLLRSTRSVNTQTPAGGDFTGSSQSSGPSSRESASPLIPGALDFSRPSSDLHSCSRGSTPDQETGKLGTSPHINKFLAREPPDGCEKVNLKFVEDTRRPMIDLSKLDYCPLKPCSFQLRPSLGSAFMPLQHHPAAAARDTAAPAAPVNGDLSPTSASAPTTASKPLVPQGAATAVSPLSNDHNNDKAGI